MENDDFWNFLDGKKIRQFLGSFVERWNLGILVIEVGRNELFVRFLLGLSRHTRPVWPTRRGFNSYEFGTRSEAWRHV